jgi:SAM-dependent methyltransferase
MTSWSSGYVTDVAYMPGWYPQQSPLHMAVTCLLMGVACDLPAGHEEVSYLELGSGLGFGALALAAANPSWRITGIDFNPAHVAFARTLARDAGLGNITFLEADLATLAESDAVRQVPEADFVSLHGLWSWVAPEVRAGILRLLAARVRAGGVVHASYNALPAWQGGLGLQRTLRLAGMSGSTRRSDRRAVDGAALVRDLLAAEATHLTGSAFASGIAAKLEMLPPAYLAHEYMNAHWAPCFHADVAAAFAEARLDWIGSAMLTSNFPELTLSDAQRVIYDRNEDPLLRELIKDMCLPRSLREDVFVRGTRPLRPEIRDAVLRDLTLALATPLDTIAYEVAVPSGTATLSPEFYRPMLAALAEAPQRVGDLLDLSPVEQRRRNPREVVGMLVGIGHAVPLLRPGLPPHPTATRFNGLAAGWLVRPENITKPLALAGVSVGGGFPASVFDLFVAARLCAGEDEGALEGWVGALGAQMDADERAKLSGLLGASLRQKVPLLRASGVL